MVRIIYGTHVLLDPTSEIHLLNVELVRSLREASTLTFSMPITHPAFGEIELGSVTPEIEVWDGDDCLMRGRALTCDNIDDVGTVEYTCEGELAYLNDTAVRPYSTVSGAAPALAPSDPYGYFTWLISNHNQAVEPAKRFVVGVNQGNLLDDNEHILRSDSTYPSTGRVIREKLLESLGGFVRPHYGSYGTRYIDYLADTDGTATQRIELGVNLLKFARTRDGSPIRSAVIPLGDTPEDSEDRITIKSLPNGPADAYARYVKRGDTIMSVDLVAKVGYREQAVEWDDVTEPKNLLSNGLAWLAGQANEIETLRVSAYDLSRIGQPVEPIRLGDYVRITSDPHHYDSYMIVSAITSRPTDPSGDEYTFGLEDDDIGDIVRKHAQTLNAGINNVYEVAQSVDTVAKDAVKTAVSAQVTADKAKTDAAEAVTKVTEVSSTVTTVKGQVEASEAKITQNANSITSIATRTTAVEGKFASYPTTTQVQSAIDQKADAITSSVSKTYATQSTVAGVKATADAAKKKIIHSTTGGATGSGLFFVAQIKIGAAHVDSPIKITISQRNRQQSSAYIAFYDSATIDPDVNLFRADGDSTFYLAKQAASTWGLYVTETKAWDQLSVVDLDIDNYISNAVSVTWQSTQIASVAALPTPNYAPLQLVGKTPANLIATKAELKIESDRITSNVSETTNLGTRMTTVEQTAGGLSVSLADTKTAVSAAQTAASAAKTTAEAAKTTAATAGTSASAAVTTANAASTKATTAANDASAAKTSAASATTTANAASATAGTASTTATAAQSTANTANTTANTANTTANAAKTGAANAQAAANTAQSTANTARTEAANASKTATNFLSFSTAGLEVGNKTSGAWSGLRTRVTSSAFQVLSSAGAILASYGASLIEIGANAINTVIRMCGGKATISYNTTSNQLMVMSASSIAMTTCTRNPAGVDVADDHGVAVNKSGVVIKGAVELAGALSINHHKVPRTYIDTWVGNPGGNNHINLFTDGWFRLKFGRPYTNGRDFVLVLNGDGYAASLRFYPAEIWHGDCWIYLDRYYNGSVRIDYMIILDGGL